MIQVHHRCEEHIITLFDVVFTICVSVQEEVVRVGLARHEATIATAAPDSNASKEGHGSTGDENAAPI
jgi:hypothetical protein